MIVPFNLDKLGETIYVTSLDGAGMLGGYRHKAVMDYGFNSTTYIRYTNSTGEVQYVPSACDARAPQLASSRWANCRSWHIDSRARHQRGDVLPAPWGR